MSENGDVNIVTVTLDQLQMAQNMIDMWASNLNSLRTKCSTNSDLIKQEIRTLEVCIRLI